MFQKTRCESIVDKERINHTTAEPVIENYIVIRYNVMHDTVVPEPWDREHL